MFAEFWQKKKHTIELIGILTAIGALFLNIPLPENEKARLALINIQFIWLFILTFSMALLCFNFFYLAIKLEGAVKEKFRFDISDTISMAVSIVSVWLLYSLWQYLIILYTHQLQLLMNRMSIIFSFFLPVIYLKLRSIIYQKISKKYFQFILSIVVCFIISLIPASWSQLEKLDFRKWDFLSSLFLNTLIYLGILLIVSLLDFFFEKKNNKLLLFNQNISHNK